MRRTPARAIARSMAPSVLLLGAIALVDLGCSPATTLKHGAAPVELGPSTPAAVTASVQGADPHPPLARAQNVPRPSGNADMSSTQDDPGRSQSIPELFQDVIEGVARAETPGPEVMRARLVRIDASLLRGTSAGVPTGEPAQALRLNLFDDATAIAELDRIDMASEGFTWVGRVAGDPLSSVTLASVGSVVSGSVATTDAVYAVRYVAESIHEIQQIDQSAYPSELEPLTVPATPDADRSPATRASHDSLPTVHSDSVASSDDGSTIDVMVLYTPAARQAAGGTSGIQSRINLGISESNTSYANSGVTQRLRLVHSQEVSHTENNDLAQDLYLLTNYNGNWISTDLGNTAAALRDTHKADLVMLVTNPASPGGCGVAWQMAVVSTGFAPYGFSVVWENCISPNYTFAHELGHNMGARHDWFVDSGTAPHTYAHGYVSPPDRWRTVMAYNNLCSTQGFTCTRLLHWSNPGVTYGGVPTGIAGGTRSNCTLGNINDTACDADDHRTLNDTAWAVANFRQQEVLQAPVVTTHPAPARTSVGGTVGFTAAASGIPTPAVRWQSSTDGGTTWADLIESSRYVGVTSTTLTVTNVPAPFNATRVRAVFTNSQGSAPTNAALLEVTTAVSFSPGVLNYGATKAGAAGPLVAVTPAQAVTVTFSGITSAWTAQSDVAWLQVARGTGNGSGQFSVSVVNPGNVISGSTSLNGNVLVDVALAPTPLQVRLSVRLSVDQSGGLATSPPFGLVSSPGQNTTGIVGALGITGWVLDDVGLDYVRLFRNCLSFDDPLACQWVDGQHVVWLGDATIVPGARPDVESLYATYPQNNRAGWGYAMLTNMAPHIPLQQMFGGQGPLTLYVRARDLEGKEAWLGRDFLPGSTTLSDGQPTLITMANDTIGEPFGTIDLPRPGDAWSGGFWTWGWVLTPDSNTTGGEAGDILVPTSGSTITVWIDGVARGTVTYNQCRGLMAPYCIDDIASIFGHATPQPIGTPRTSNPTRYRNLDANRGAIGGFFLDTTTLANGLHTIAWGAYDNATPTPRGQGLGSRYFTVLNPGTDADRRQATGDRRQGEDRDLGSGARSVGLSRRDTTNLDSRLPNPGGKTVLGRTGFALDAPLVELQPDANGVRHVQLGGLDRLELQLPGFGRALSPALSRVEGPNAPDVGDQDDMVSGYLVAKGEYRPLPVGSHLDVETGTFTWAPGVGFVGTYRLAFKDSRSRAGVVPDLSRTTPALERESLAVVDVTIRPVTLPVIGEAVIRMSLDAPQPGATASAPFVVAGWALDPHAAIGSGIGAIHVWAQRQDVPGAVPQFLGAALLGGARPDVASVYGAGFSHTGYSLSVDPGTLAPGTYALTAYAWNLRTARWEDARTVTITVR